MYVPERNNRLDNNYILCIEQSRKILHKSRTYKVWAKEDNMSTIKFFIQGYNQVKKMRKDEAKKILARLIEENEEDGKEILASLEK